MSISIPWFSLSRVRLRRPIPWSVSWLSENETDAIPISSLTQLSWSFPAMTSHEITQRCLHQLNEEHFSVFGFFRCRSYASPHHDCDEQKQKKRKKKSHLDTFACNYWQLQLKQVPLYHHNGKDSWQILRFACQMDYSECQGNESESVLLMGSLYICTCIFVI